MGHQPEVMYDEGISGLLVPGGVALQILPFLLRLEGPWKGAGGVIQPEGKEQGVEHEHEPGGNHGQDLPQKVLSILCRRVLS